MLHINQIWCLIASHPEELRRAALQQDTDEIFFFFFSKSEKESQQKCFSLQGGNRSGPLLGKTNIDNPLHIRTQTLYSLKRILDNGLSLGIHSIPFMSPHGDLRPFPTTSKEGVTLQTVNSAAFLSDPRGSPIYTLFTSKLSST